MILHPHILSSLTQKLRRRNESGRLPDLPSVASSVLPAGGALSDSMGIPSYFPGGMSGDSYGGAGTYFKNTMVVHHCQKRR